MPRDGIHSTFVLCFTRVERHQGTISLHVSSDIRVPLVCLDFRRFPFISFDFIWCPTIAFDIIWFRMTSLDFLWLSLISFDIAPSHEGRLSYNHCFSASSASMHLLRFEGSLSYNRDVLHTQPSAPSPLPTTCPHPPIMASIFLAFYWSFYWLFLLAAVLHVFENPFAEWTNWWIFFSRNTAECKNTWVS